MIFSKKKLLLNDFRCSDGLEILVDLKEILAIFDHFISSTYGKDATFRWNDVVKVQFMSSIKEKMRLKNFLNL